MHESNLGRFGTNIHGHLHAHRVTQKVRWGDTAHFDEVIDPRYHCVCVEQTDFRPILLEDVFKRIVQEGGSVVMKSREEVYGPN
jgi:calcineurin-like phosphoesterase family protein